MAMSNQLASDNEACQGDDFAIQQPSEYNPMDSPQARRWKQSLHFDCQRATEESL
ncbi:MAG: hypothetical protein R6W06_13780 [Prochlorococcaceae cyanobacterium]